MGNTKMVREAMAFAMQSHEGQTRRKSLLPYITHPIGVFSIVKKFKESKNIDEILCAALLHDTIEDCGVEAKDLEKRFNRMVASIVVELTNDEEEKEKIGKEEYMNKKLLTLTNYALVVKLADILDNTSDNPTEFMLNRVSNNMKHLIENRILTSTQQKIYDQILQLIEEYSPVNNKLSEKEEAFNPPIEQPQVKKSIFYKLNFFKFNFKTGRMDE